ncbi:MAG TPA: hypothetical protein VHN59_08385 [Chitinophagaceae bacterium]|nr:hypothetical protein [Chitinophagaceae bacterium]
MRSVLIAFVMVAGFAGCRMLQGEGFDTYFWTSSAAQKVYLFIDGENKGELPYLPTAPDCDNEESKKNALMVALPAGSYEIAVKNAEQKILYGERLRLKRRGGSLSIGNSTSYEDGGSRRSFKDACLIEELYFNQ